MTMSRARGRSFAFPGVGLRRYMYLYDIILEHPLWNGRRFENLLFRACLVHGVDNHNENAVLSLVPSAANSTLDMI